MQNQLFLSLIFIFALFSCQSTYEKKQQKVVKHPVVLSPRSIDSICGAIDSNEVVILGSTTLKPLMTKFIESYSKTDSNFTYSLHSEGSHDGFNALKTGKGDLIMSSVKISPGDELYLHEHKMEYVETIIAGDALVIIVNIHNKVKHLTKEQIMDIFTGKIRNWKLLGGHDAAIEIYARQVNSGTNDFFEKEVLENRPHYSYSHLYPDSEGIIKKIQTNKNAIGYVSFSNIDYSIDPVNISFDKGKSFVSPRIETINNYTYKYYRPLYLYYRPSSYEKMKNLLAYIKSDKATGLISSAGFLPVSNSLYAKN